MAVEPETLSPGDTSVDSGSVFSRVVTDPKVNPNSTLLLLGTSSPGGVYFPTGLQLCRVINQVIVASGIRCLALNTGGSVYNIYAVHNYQLQMAITRNDLLEDAYLGKGDFADSPLRELRMVMPLYDNPLSIIVRADSSARKLEDLRGKKVNVGALGSGRHAFSKFLFKLKGMDKGYFAGLTGYGSSKMMPALCAGKTDAVVQLIGYPSAFYDNLHAGCAVRVLSFDERTMAAMQKQKPLLTRIKVDYRDAAGNTKSFITVSTKAVLFSAANRISGVEMNAVLQQIRDNINYLRNNSSITHSPQNAGETANALVPYFNSESAIPES